MKHAHGCNGGRVRQTYRRDVSPRRYCGSCRRLQGERPTVYRDPLPMVLEAVQAGRQGTHTPSESNRPKSLIARALDRLRLS